MFGIVHIYWALGGTLGLPTGFVMHDNIPIFMADLVAIPLCGVAALLAIALSRAPPSGRRPWLVLAAGVAASILFFAHSVPPLTMAVIDAAKVGSILATEKDRLSLLVYEPFWLLGGILFGAAAYRFRSAIIAS
ncbi:MAG: DUF3995 domain-containing protein [Sphingosinicella sp.]|nr:DUF3995 domain-containing protein [Sphingosinicella sp.]